MNVRGPRLPISHSTVISIIPSSAQTLSDRCGRGLGTVGPWEADPSNGGHIRAGRRVRIGTGIERFGREAQWQSNDAQES